ncbi:hypothetical protein C1645_834728 [Glomus cerebriforme]|uniref:Uncharacterized protein n=1 Tax=Glomus cerebriforme TaxID=658196 RepID=A0A397SJX0_9GLOM|nr:hypothetical protein C1645_834728 [Glomus cerebriforme]
MERSYGITLSSKNTISNLDSNASEKDQKEKESVNKINKFTINKGNNDKSITSNNSDNINFVKCIEESKSMLSTC